MPVAEGVRLNQELLAVSSGGGVAAIVAGLLLLAAGGVVATVGLDVIPLDPERVLAPGWVLLVVAGIFGVPGLLLLPRAVVGIRADRRRRAELERRPSEPWLADRNWNERGAAFTSTRRFVACALGTGYLALFLTPFHWAAFFSGEGILPIKLLVGAFDLLLVFAIFESARRFLAMVRYGRSEVLFDSFPFFVGETLSVRFRRPANSVFLSLTCVLQCVEERLETSTLGSSTRRDNASTSRVPYALWQQKVVREDASGAGMPDVEDELRFDLPADLPGNRLDRNPPTYWQLMVSGEAAGPDYEGRFLLPVYERPGA